LVLDNAILAEFGTLHMEFAYLTEIVGDYKYEEKVKRIREVKNKPDFPAL
jgi:mannosyl-oligosaccharide alpha-1,2-mannosidase